MAGAAGSSTAPPAFRFRHGQASLWTVLREGIGDVGAVIPDAILDDFVVQINGRGAPLVVSSPDLAREVLNDRADHFDRDRYIRRLFRRSWGKGLAAAEGTDWERQRRAVVPFFTPKAVKDRLAAIANSADIVASKIDDGSEVDLVRLSGQIVARVVLWVLVDGGNLVDPDSAAADIPAYIGRIAGFGLIDLLPLSESLIDRLHGIDSDPAVQRLRAMAARIARARGESARHDDLIALIEGVGPVEDNIRGLFPAAMDTTVAGLGWALHMLALHPEWQDEVAAEGQAMGAVPSLEAMPATRQVISELLRLYPPAPLLARSAAHEMEIAGHPVRAGQTVLVCIYALHRHRKLWDNPDTFDPARWERSSQFRDAYMPFGTGPRMCVAAHFAQAEMAVILARLAAQFRFEPIGSDPKVSIQTTTRSLNGIGSRLLRRMQTGDHAASAIRSS